jgi:hypothetical protein
VGDEPVEHLDDVVVVDQCVGQLYERPGQQDFAVVVDLAHAVLPKVPPPARPFRARGLHVLRIPDLPLPKRGGTGGTRPPSGGRVPDRTVGLGQMGRTAWACGPFWP